MNVLEQDKLERIGENFTKINDEYSSFNAVSNVTTFTRNTNLYCFSKLWSRIPNNYLVKEFETAFSDAGHNMDYSCLYQPSLLNKVKELNEADRTNPTLIRLLDNKGFLTVYRGFSASDGNSALSWTLNKDTAKWFGNRSAYMFGDEKYSIHSGKVNISNVIAYVTHMNEDEIAVEPKYVLNWTNETFTRHCQC